MKANGKKGVTISVKKRGGWKTSWSLAKKVAGWD